MRRRIADKEEWVKTDLTKINRTYAGWGCPADRRVNPKQRFEGGSCWSKMWGRQKRRCGVIWWERREEPVTYIPKNGMGRTLCDGCRWWGLYAGGSTNGRARPGWGQGELEINTRMTTHQVHGSTAHVFGIYSMRRPLLGYQTTSVFGYDTQVRAR